MICTCEYGEAKFASIYICQFVYVIGILPFPFAFRLYFLNNLEDAPNNREKKDVSFDLLLEGFGGIEFVHCEISPIGHR